MYIYIHTTYPSPMDGLFHGKPIWLFNTSFPRLGRCAVRPGRCASLRDPRPWTTWALWAV